MMRSSRVRCVSKCVFFYNLWLEFGKQNIFCYSYLLLFSSASHLVGEPCGNTSRVVTTWGSIICKSQWCLQLVGESVKTHSIAWTLHIPHTFISLWLENFKFNSKNLPKPKNNIWHDLREKLGFVAFNVPGSVLDILHLLNSVNLKLLIKISISFSMETTAIWGRGAFCKKNSPSIMISDLIELLIYPKCVQPSILQFYNSTNAYWVTYSVSGQSGCWGYKEDVLHFLYLKEYIHKYV